MKQLTTGPTNVERICNQWFHRGTVTLTRDSADFRNPGYHIIVSCKTCDRPPCVIGASISDEGKESPWMTMIHTFRRMQRFVEAVQTVPAVQESGVEVFVDVDVAFRAEFHTCLVCCRQYDQRQEPSGVRQRAIQAVLPQLMDNDVDAWTTLLGSLRHCNYCPPRVSHLEEMLRCSNTACPLSHDIGCHYRPLCSGDAPFRVFSLELHFCFQRQTTAKQVGVVMQTLEAALPPDSDLLRYYPAAMLW